MKTLHSYAFGLILVVGCSDASPSGDAPTTAGATQQPSYTEDQQPDASAPAILPLYAPLPAVPKPLPPCLSCPQNGLHVGQQH